VEVRKKTAETLASYAEEIEGVMGAYIRSSPYPESKITDAMRYSLLGGGKRIRGALLMAFYRLFHENTEAVLPFACAIEMIHAYSLIHDDLPCMDDDDLRRGKPSCHKAFGEATALLAGDALLTLAFDVMAGAGTAGTGTANNGVVNAFSPEIVLRVISCLSAAAGYEGMIGGQILDLEMEGRSPAQAELDRMNSKKTGALIRTAAFMGCLLAEADEEEKDAALRYAGHLGAAFQIVDDILDVTGDEALLGKPIGSDGERNKSTYVSLLGLEEAAQRAEEHKEQAKAALDALDALAGSGAKAGLDLRESEPGVVDTWFLRGLADMLAERQR